MNDVLESIKIQCEELDQFVQLHSASADTIVKDALYRYQKLCDWENNAFVADINGIFIIRLFSKLNA